MEQNGCLIFKQLWVVGMILFFNLSSTLAQPNNINITNCDAGSSNINGNYEKVADMCGGCNAYKKIGAASEYAYIFELNTALWAYNNVGLTCGTVGGIFQSAETDCDPTNGGSSANGCLVSAGILPVIFTSWQVNQLGEGIELLWQVAMEQNNKGFELQRSSNGSDFKTIKFIRGNGTSQTSATYTFLDTDLSLGYLYYYRLKQMDYDGTFSYSDIITAQLEGSATGFGTFFPNPVYQDVINIEVVSAAYQSWQIEIFTAQGRLMHQETFLPSQDNDILSISIETIPIGAYVAVFYGNGRTFYRKFMKK